MCAKAEVCLVLWYVAMMPEKCVWVSRKKSLGEQQEKEKRMRSVTRLDCQQHIWHARLPAHFKMPRLTCVNVNKYLSVQEHKRYAQAHHHEGKISKKNPRLSPGKYLASTYMWESFILLFRNLKTEVEDLYFLLRIVLMSSNHKVLFPVFHIIWKVTHNNVKFGRLKFMSVISRWKFMEWILMAPFKWIFFCKFICIDVQD